MKVARLGRQSFKTVKNNRDYLQGRTQYNWLYLSRLATTREYDYMKALHAKGFPVPEPIDSNRHVICMSLLPAHTICKVGSIADPEKVYNQAMDLLVKFAEQGLIHGDFNEFNLLLSSSLTLYCIDFPQMVSRSHPEAEYFFKRDFECIQTLFKRKYRLEGEREYELKDVDRVGEIDREVKASGWDIEKGGKDKGGIEEYYRRRRIEGGKEGEEGEEGEDGESGEEDRMEDDEEEGESEGEYEGGMMDEGNEEFDEEEYEQDELLEQSDDEKKVEEKLPETPLEKEPQEEEESEEEESEDLEAAQERRRRGKELKRQAKQAQMEARQKAVQKFKEEIAAKKEAEAKAKEARGDEEEDDSEDSLSDNETKERIKKSLKKKFKQKKPNRAKHNHPKKANALAKQM